MGDLLKQATTSPAFNALVREPAGRTAEGMAGMADLPMQSANLISGGIDRMLGLTPAPQYPLLAPQARQAFGIPPAEQLPTWQQRAGATAWQALGPTLATAGAGKLAESPILKSERGSVTAPPAEETGPLWRDNILDALQEWPQDKGTSGQLRAHLAKFRGTKDQADWIGLEDFLKDKQNVTKQEVESFVRANQLTVEEKMLPHDERTAISRDAASLMYDAHDAELAQLKRKAMDEQRLPAESRTPGLEREIYRLERLREDARIARDQPSEPAKYGQYQTPGGSNYRELLIKLPGKQPSEKWDWGPGGVGEYLEGGFNSSHWSGDPNVLAHIRFNERTDVNGKPMAFIEEVQSDWHQQGKKGGYAKRGELATPPDAQEFVDFVNSRGRGQQATTADDITFPILRGLGASEEMLDRFAQWENYQMTGFADWREGASHGVPDAPFKKTWPLLSMKRMIRWAVDNGFDQIGWTTGKMQAARYNMQLKDIVRAYDNGLEDGGVNVVMADGHIQTLNGPQIDELHKLLGDRAAGLKDEGGVDLSQEPLTIGGEAMKNFYDRELPNEVNKFVKRYGGRVTTSTIDTGRHDLTTDDANAMLRGEYRESHGPTKKESIWRLEITPELKKAAKRGLELSQAQGESAVA